MVLQNLEGNWKTFLFTVEKDLVRLLLVESGKAIANIESEMETDLKKEDLVGFQKKNELWNANMVSIESQKEV